jgi:hypothetical protein
LPGACGVESGVCARAEVIAAALRKMKTKKRRMLENGIETTVGGVHLPTGLSIGTMRIPHFVRNDNADQNDNRAGILK